MNNILKGLIAGYGAKKLGGGCFSTILVFALIWIVLGQCAATYEPAPADRLPTTAPTPPVDHAPHLLVRPPGAGGVTRHAPTPSHGRQRYVLAMRPVLLAVALALAVPASAQRTAPPLPDTTAARYGSSAALVLQLTEYGLGAGGALRRRLSDDWSATAELAVGAGRDEREQSFGGGLFGERVTPFKRNYVVLVPLQVGVERRLFRTRVEDNFRPFAAVAVGPTLAYQYPYFDDLDGDGRRDDGEDLRSGVGALGDGQARVGVGGRCRSAPRSARAGGRRRRSGSGSRARTSPSPSTCWRSRRWWTTPRAGRS